MSQQEARRVQAQARPGADAGAVHGKRGSGEGSRSSSSSGTTRAGSTTTSGSSATARSPRWAVPKGVPLEPGQRALAVHVEDHPLDYATFAGEIPKGNYGAGTVEIWDNGTYELVEEKRDGGLTVRLHGKRLEGTWTLVPAHLDGKEQNWLLIRKRDEGAPRARPPRLQPMLATLAEELPSGDDWLYEVKWDGYRALGYVARRRGAARLAERQRPDGALRRRREGAREGGALAGLRRRRRGLRARRAGPAELLGDAAGERARARLRGLRRARDRRRSRSSTCRSTERRERLEALLDAERRPCSSPGSSTTARRCSRPRREQGLEGVMAKRAARATSRASAAATG